jgi:hypothetical protein
MCLNSLPAFRLSQMFDTAASMPYKHRSSRHTMELPQHGKCKQHSGAHGSGSQPARVHYLDEFVCNLASCIMGSI